MPATGRSDGEVARLLGISLPVFYTILTRERPISAATAAMLGRLFNTGDQFWLKMQAEYDRFVAPQNVVESHLPPTDVPARPSSLGQEMQLRNLPKPIPASFPDPADHAVSEFCPPEVAPWGRAILSNDSGSIG